MCSAALRVRCPRRSWWNTIAGVVLKCFAGENVTIGQSARVSGNIYTLKDLVLEKATSIAPTVMTGLYIANNINAQDFVEWRWNEGCPFAPAANLSVMLEDRTTPSSPGFGPLQISPNPASEEAQLQFFMESGTSVMVQLFDATGKQVKTWQFEADQGMNQLSLHLGNLPEGLYHVYLSANGLRSIEKLVVLRP
jgi:hypothetical protein